jgi:3-oxoacyl-[acyl-carrier protein] reductase
MTPVDGYPAAARLGFSEIELGQVFEIERAFSREDTLAFARVSGDFSPLHVEPDYAAGTEFGGCVVHGILLASLFSQLIGMRVPGQAALYLGQDLTFRRHVLVGETVRATAKVTAKSEATRMLVLATEIRSLDGKVVVAGTAKVRVRDTGPRVSTPVADTSNDSLAVPRSAERRVAIVTGASGGIGAEIARTLACKGRAVAVNYYQHRDRAAAVVDAIHQAGGTAHMAQADVRDASSVEAMLHDVTENLGMPTILVNAAIGELGQRAFTELSWPDFQTHMEYQVKAVFNLCQAMYPLMKQAGGGAVVNMLSQVTAGTPPVRMADYVTAKHALEGLSKALAAEWAADGIRVNMVSPGLTRTELTEFQHERVFKMEAARTPLRRLASVEDIARAVDYLASEEASFLTGVNLFVTGGQVML